MVTLSITRSLKVPLATQIRDQVVAAIAAGDLKVGDRLPTIRQLASYLEINRNTVAQAYRELEREGYVLTRSGGGTSVTASPATDSPMRGSQLRQLVRDALLQAEAAGFGVQAFVQAAYYEAASWQPSTAVRILVVDEYPGELDFLCREIARAVPASSEGLVLRELEQWLADDRIGDLLRFDFAVAPFYCTDRATQILEKVDLPLLTVGVGPSISTVVRIAQAGEGKALLIVCTEDCGPDQMQHALLGAGISFARLDGASLRDKRLAGILESYDLIVASEGSADTVRAMVGAGRVLEYSSLVSDSSLATVRSYVEHVSRKKASGRPVGDSGVVG